MFGWALILLTIAVVTGVLGFTTLAGTAASIAKILFLVFFVLVLVSVLSRGVQGKSS